jgi:hypothetical protein
MDKFELDCTALDDYAECYSKVKQMLNNNQARVDEYMADMCSSGWGVVRNPCSSDPTDLLSAYQWLAPLGSPFFVQAGGQLDLRSGMLYRSEAGGKTRDSVVYRYINDDGTRSLIIPDGGYTIYPPSPLDAEGATMLSPNPRDSTVQAPYYSEASPFHATYEDDGNPFNDCNSDPFDDDCAPDDDGCISSGSSSSSSSRRSMERRSSKRHEQLQRRGEEARAAMRARFAAGSYI